MTRVKLRSSLLLIKSRSHVASQFYRKILIYASLEILLGKTYKGEEAGETQEKILSRVAQKIIRDEARKLNETEKQCSNNKLINKRNLNYFLFMLILLYSCTYVITYKSVIKVSCWSCTLDATVVNLLLREQCIVYTRVCGREKFPEAGKISE